MTLLSRILIILLAVVLVVALVAGTGFLFVTRQSFPQISGRMTLSQANTSRVQLPGLTGEVEIIRDIYGVPHIYADAPGDLFRAQGFVHAQDRFFQMEFSRRIGQGRIAELFGPGALEQDKFIRTVGWARVAEEEARLLDLEMTAILENYAAGVNAYALNNADRLGLEFKVLALTGASWSPEPWQPLNSLTWGKAMAWNLGDNLDAELARAALIERGGQALADALLPAYPADMPVIVPSSDTADRQDKAAKVDKASSMSSPSSLSKAAGQIYALNKRMQHAMGMVKGSDIGSNNWVLAGSKTDTGKPILANDPHLGIQMPSIWYQVGLHCRIVSAACPYDVVGFSFPGAPGVIIGHNARIAWGVTNSTVDTQDVFIEKPNPDNPNEFEFKGQFEPAQVREEKIAVRGQAEPAVITVRVTRHGPIINDAYGIEGQPPMALSWAALRPGNLFKSVIELNRAQNWDDFRAALRHWSAPSQNFVYADVDGNIGYQFPGDIPIRAQGDGSVPVPGWTGEHAWSGFIPFESLPSRYNPPEGYIVTANNAIVDASYPHLLMARDMDHGFRAKRIVEMLNVEDTFTVEDMRQMHFDAHSPFADDVLLQLSSVSAEGDATSQAALQALKAWDKRYARDSVGALIFEKYWLRLAHLVFDDEIGDGLQEVIGTGSHTRIVMRTLLADPAAPWWDNVATPEQETREGLMAQAFAETAADLKTKLGADVNQWQWGKLHQATFANQTLGRSGISLIEGIFNRGPFPAEGGSALVNATGHTEALTVRAVPSMRMIVDMADLSRSLAIHTTGQSGHAYNAHYDDMIAKWLNGEQNPMLWSRADVQKNAEATLVLTP